MYVPSDSFGGKSPEKKAGDMLRTMFTFCAVKVVLAQLEGSGRGALGSYNSSQYQTLQDLLHRLPMRNGDEWLKSLMELDPMLTLRVMEVREAYCEGEAQEGFEWGQLQKLAGRDMKDANAKLLQGHAASVLARSLDATRAKQASS